MNLILPAVGNIPKKNAHQYYFDDWSGETASDTSQAVGQVSSGFHGVNHLDSPRLKSVTIWAGDLIGAIGATYEDKHGSYTTRHGDTAHHSAHKIDLTDNSLHGFSTQYGTKVLVDGHAWNYILQIQLYLRKSASITTTPADSGAPSHQDSQTPIFGKIPDQQNNQHMTGWVSPQENFFNWPNHNLIAFLGFLEPPPPASAGDTGIKYTHIGALGCILAPG